MSEWEPIVLADPEACADTLGRIYPFPYRHPHYDGICVRCGKAVDPAEQPAAPERPTA
jgi:hypothetical protein